MVATVAATALRNEGEAEWRPPWATTEVGTEVATALLNELEAEWRPQWSPPRSPLRS